MFFCLNCNIRPEDGNSPNRLCGSQTERSVSVGVLILTRSPGEKSLPSTEYIRVSVSPPSVLRVCLLGFCCFFFPEVGFIVPYFFDFFHLPFRLQMALHSSFFITLFHQLFLVLIYRILFLWLSLSSCILASPSERRLYCRKPFWFLLQAHLCQSLNFSLCMAVFVCACTSVYVCACS